MRIKIQATGLELTPAIVDYVEKRLQPLEKLFDEDGGDILLRVEVGVVTRHHKQGDVFRAEANTRAYHQDFRAVAETSDLYAAIDEVREELEREVVSRRSKDRTLFRRGAAVVKDLMKGFGKFKWKGSTRFPRFRKPRE